MESTNLMVSEENEYNKQAREWLELTGTTLTRSFWRNDKFFGANDNYRNIWLVFMKKNGERVYTFRYGDSIANSEKGRIRPSDYDILTSLSSDYSISSYSKQEFKNEFGTKGNQRGIYEKLQKLRHALESNYTESELEQLLEIQ
jgi:hypothetical protein